MTSPSILSIIFVRFVSTHDLTRTHTGNSAFAWLNCQYGTTALGLDTNHRYLYPYNGPKIGKNCYYKN